jgi:hypothetical protein
MLIAVPVLAEEPAATPYRPTVSNPADLSAPGLWEIEAGGLYSKGGGLVRRHSLPWLAKYAFNDRFGIMVGGEALISETDAVAGRDRGVGDTTVTLKMKMPANAESALGLEAGVKLPTASNNLGSGNSDLILNGIYSHKTDAATLDFNLGVTHLGEVGIGEGANQIGWAVAASRELGRGFGIAGEFSGAFRHNAGSTSQFLGALTYSVSPRLVLDVGAAWGLNRQSPDWSAFAGMTLLLK